MIVFDINSRSDLNLKKCDKNMKKTDYGLTLSNPVRLNSVTSSIAYLENLVTEKGYHFLYHRVGSLLCDLENESEEPVMFDHPIDHYQLFDGDSKYHDIFINIYTDEIEWIPPKGFLFENIMINYREDDYEFIIIDDEYVYNDDYDFDNFETEAEKLPEFEKRLLNNFGINFCDSEFPFGVLKQYLEVTFNDDGEQFEKIKKILK